MRSVLHDIRYGARSLARTPGFTVMAITVLAVGIGVNATIFSLANAFFLRPLAVAQPDAVVRVYSNRFSNTPYSTYLELRNRNTTLEAIAGFRLQSFALGVDADAEHVFGELVTGNYFPALGIVAARGRVLEPADDRPDAPPVVVLSHGFWLRRFGASPDVIGRTFRLNGVLVTVVGVTPNGFTGVLAPLAADLWLPLAADTVLRPALSPQARLDAAMHLVGRLKPGVERAQAQADLDAIGQQLRGSADAPSRGPAITVYGSTMLHPEISPPITAFTAVLMGLVALVLLIVCVNVANLVLARGAGRRTEFALRQSLGAGRGRLVRQLLIENLLLSLSGAVGGVMLAFWCTPVVSSTPLPVPVPIALDLSIDWRVLMFTVGIAVVATLAFGIVPATSAAREDLVSSLKNSAGASRHGRLRAAFLVAQVAMSVLFLVVAGLAIRSFRYAQSIDRGFDATNVLTASLDLETRGYSSERGREFIRTLSERLEAEPAVTDASLVDIVPLTLSNQTGRFLRDGDAVPSRDQTPPTPQVYVNSVSPGHFFDLAHQATCRARLYA